MESRRAGRVGDDCGPARLLHACGTRLPRSAKMPPLRGEGEVSKRLEEVLPVAARALQSGSESRDAAMAAMEAARAMGGDGRCSCSGSDPDGCGSPPPSFTKSAHTAFVVLARLGNTDGGCGQLDGCAAGNYYLSLATVNQHRMLFRHVGEQVSCFNSSSGDDFVAEVTFDFPCVLCTTQLHHRRSHRK